MVADFETSIYNGHAAVLLTENELAGYIIFYAVEEEMHLENVAVRPEHSGNGFGRALIHHVEAAASAAAMDAVNLYTNEAMTENLAMYVALGYTELKRCREAGFNRVYFRKSLL